MMCPLPLPCSLLRFLDLDFYIVRGQIYQQHHCSHLIHSLNQILPLKTHPLNLCQLTRRCRWKEHQSLCITWQNMSNQPGKCPLGWSRRGGRTIWSWVCTSQNYPFMWAAGVDSGVEVGLPVAWSTSLYHHMTNDFRIWFFSRFSWIKQRPTDIIHFRWG